MNNKKIIKYLVRFIFKLSILFNMAVLSSCGLGSLYGPSYYEDTALGEGLRRVTFQGGYHPATGELCLLRCSEVCLEQGFSHFEVVDSETGSSLESGLASYPFDRYYPSRDLFMDDIPFVAKTIRMFKEKPKENFAYDAREIQSSLRRKYDIK